MQFKVQNSSNRFIGNLLKTSVPMKAIILLSIITSILTGTQCYSQTITLSLKNVSLEKAFKEIRKQTSYSFVYTREQINKSNPVNLNIKDASINQALDICFSNQPLTFVIDSKHIIVKDKPQIINSIAATTGLDIKGKVINEQNEPVVGATVAVEGTNYATATDEKGEFGFSYLREEDILYITSIGYEARKIPVRGRSGIIIKMANAVSRLDETVIIAYGKTTKRLNTGSVSKVSEDELGRQPVSNLLSAIQGRMPGVFVNTQNGMPGGNITVQIRGRGSINAGTDPLYIIDGVPFISTPLNLNFSLLSTGISGATSPLNSLNPNDIESIEVLKDADATAIYGSRAANGVVLITTKKGASGKTKVDVTLNTGISRLATFPKLLNLKQYLELRREGFKNDGFTPTAFNAPDLLVWDTTKSTDWPKYLLGGKAVTSNAQISLSGGNEFTNFLISGNLKSEGTILPGDNEYQRAGVNFSLRHASTDKKFSFNFSSNFSSDNNSLISSSIFGILSLPPNFSIYNDEGIYNWDQESGVNPAAVLLRRSKSNTLNLLSNLILKYKISQSLEVRTSFGYNRIEMDQIMTYPSLSLDPDFGSSSYAYYGNNRNTSIIIEPQAEYGKKINQSNLKFLVGSTWQQSLREGSFLTGSDYNNDNLLEFQGAAATISATNLYNSYKYASIFGRFHYDYREKYLVNISGRRDGSSRFGPGKQYGNFGSIGAAWIFNKESFLIGSKLISYGKIRSSYGLTGNDQISDYQYLSTYGRSGNYQGIVGLIPTRIANADFGWESNRKFETALEIGLLKDKILFTAARYQNKSGNQLIDYPLPFISGPFARYMANLPALIENKGWEFEINALPIKNENISLSVFGNISIPKNKLLKYPGLEASAFANSYVIGEDINIMKAFHFLGINTETGLPQFEDIDHDGFINGPEDYTIVGKTSPFFYGGFGCDFSFRQFQFNIFFQFSKQYAQGIATIPGLQSNSFNFAMARWQKNGDITYIPKPTVAPTIEYFGLAESDAAFYNASYIRLKNLSIAYKMPTKMLNSLKFSDLKIYVEAQNLIIWRKKTTLYDPETALSGIPLLKTIVVGIQLTF